MVRVVSEAPANFTRQAPRCRSCAQIHVSLSQTKWSGMGTRVRAGQNACNSVQTERGLAKREDHMDISGHSEATTPLKLEPCHSVSGLTPRQSRDQGRSRLAAVDPSAAAPNPTPELALQLRDEVAKLCSDAKHRYVILVTYAPTRANTGAMGVKVVRVVVFQS
jgi:hypothetical protein